MWDRFHRRNVFNKGNRMSAPSSLEARIRRLEDLEEIRRLKYRYAAFCDDHFDADGIAGLFVADGIWEGAGMLHAGREAIRRFWQPVDPPFASHLMTNPVITIDGDRANGKWWMIGPMSRLEEGQRVAYWQLATYDDDFVRTPDGWRFRHLRVDLKFRARHSDGWAEG